LKSNTHNLSISSRVWMVLRLAVSLQMVYDAKT